MQYQKDILQRKNVLFSVLQASGTDNRDGGSVPAFYQPGERGMEAGRSDRGVARDKRLYLIPEKKRKGHSEAHIRNGRVLLIDQCV